MPHPFLEVLIIMTCFVSFFTNRLLFSFDPEVDPMGVSLCMDYYGLMSRQYDVFIKLCTWEGTCRGIKFCSLPNICYSVALGHFLMGQTAALSLSFYLLLHLSLTRLWCCLYH